MNGKIYLIGGGEITKGETKVIDDAIKADRPNGGLLFFVAAAAGDSDGYAKVIRSVYGDNFNVTSAFENMGKEFIGKVFNEASVIYLGGGTTELLMGYAKRMEMTGLLIKSLERETVVAGMSAGALALADWYIHEDGEMMEIRKGLGLVPLCVMVHATEESKERAKVVWLNHVKAREINFVAIPEGVAYVVERGSYKCCGIGKGVWVFSAN